MADRDFGISVQQLDTAGAQSTQCAEFHFPAAAASSDSRVHFGLGSAKSVKLLEIAWPSGAVQKLQQVKGDQILTVEERGKGQAREPAP